MMMMMAVMFVTKKKDALKNIIFKIININIIIMIMIIMRIRLWASYYSYICNYYNFVV